MWLLSSLLNCTQTVITINYVSRILLWRPTQIMVWLISRRQIEKWQPNINFSSDRIYGWCCWIESNSGSIAGNHNLVVNWGSGFNLNDTVPSPVASCLIICMLSSIYRYRAVSHNDGFKYSKLSAPLLKLDNSIDFLMIWG